MHQYKIQGGIPIRGTVRASGNKNAALPCIAATLLTDEPVILRNIPEIEDTGVMLLILQALGAEVERIGEHEWRVTARTISAADIPAELSRKIRASILFAGPLVARTGKAIMPPPGGDVIGRRRVDTHFLALQELGARITVEGAFEFTANKLVGADIFLDETSVTATENAVMAAVLAEGHTIINNAASEPHVQDLCNMLVGMGAKISGIGSNILHIDGVKKLHATDFTIGADFMEIGKSFGWNLTALENTIDFMREWTKEFNTSSESETDFSFKYLYTPPYKQIMSGRCLFAYSRSNEFFALTAEQIADADFRWLSSEGEIFAEDDITSAGIYRKTREKTAAKTFLRWILSEKTQKELLDRTKEHNLSVHKFGICDGFSSIRTVNERYFPVHYKNLLGNLPGENAILAPLPLPPRWESLKSRVLIPYLSDAIKDEPPRKMQTIDDRLKMWSKQFN